MDIIKTQRINNLLDLYKDLLTEKQQEVMDMYFLYDLSLSEIALDTNTSKAAVFDLIKRTSKTLENYESKLHLLEKRKKIYKLVENIDEKTKEKILELL